MGFMEKANPGKGGPSTAALRRAAGQWLKKRREECSLSQRDLAKILGLDYYTFVSQLETGRGRIPPDRYVDWAKALQMPPKDFVFILMRYYDPITFRILFPEEGKQVVSQQRYKNAALCSKSTKEKIHETSGLG